MMGMKRRLYVLVLALIAIDQLTKFWVEETLVYHQPVEVMPFFSLFRTHNTGVAFSMLSWLGSPGLIIMTMIIIALLVWVWQRVPKNQQLTLLGFAFVIGGAIGNLIDRMYHGHVVDFFLFHTQTWAFAVFNMADAFISIGFVAIIIGEIFSSRRAPRQGDDATPAA